MSITITKEYSVDVERNAIISVNGYAQDGIKIHLREKGTNQVVNSYEYDQSWTEEEAIQDVIEFL